MRLRRAAQTANSIMWLFCLCSSLIIILSYSFSRKLYFSLSSLNIPANNCAILQKGDDLEMLPAGQHYITNPNVTLRGRLRLCRYMQNNDFLQVCLPRARTRWKCQQKTCE